MQQELAIAKERLREAESYVAQLTGETKALEGQLETAAAQLQAMGINPAQAAEALASLRETESHILSEIAYAEEQLAAALA